MVIPGNDIKSFCRSALISAKQGEEGGGGGEEGGNIPPDPEEWVYPESWLQLEDPGPYSCCLIYGFAKNVEKTMFFNIRRPSDNIYTDYDDTYCIIDWGDGTIQNINYYTNVETAENTINKQYYKIYHTFENSGHIVDNKEQYKIKISFIPKYADNSKLSGESAALFPFGKVSENGSGVLTCHFAEYFPRFSLSSSSGLTGMLDRHNTIKYIRAYELETFDVTGIGPGSAHTCANLEQIDIDIDMKNKTIYASECPNLKLIKINNKKDMVFDGLKSISLKRNKSLTKIIIKNYGTSEPVQNFLAGMSGLLYVNLPKDRFYVISGTTAEVHLI